MTLKHVAWFKFKEGVTPEQIERHLEACRGLVAKVPSLDNLECGPNTTDRAGGFTHGIIVTVADRAALEAYLSHSAHIPIAEALVEDVAELRVMDIEV
jgi:hypothetical protein